MMTLSTKTKEIPQLSEEYIDSFANESVPWGPIGYVVYKRTYARKIGNRTEEWHETTGRCVNSILKLAKGALTLEDGMTIFQYVFNLKATFSGRAMWQLGTSTVERLGGASLVNCFGGETEFITSKGIRTLASCVGQSVEVMTENGKFVPADIKEFGMQRLYKLSLSKSSMKKIIYVTDNHRWLRRPRRGGAERTVFHRIEETTAGLLLGDRLVSVYGQSIKSIGSLSPIGIMHGLVFGDGHQFNEKTTSITLCGAKNKELLPWFVNHPTYELGTGDVRVDHLPYFFKEYPYR